MQSSPPTGPRKDDDMLVNTQMTKAELNEAVAQWFERKGFDTTDRFNVNVRTIPGDRPFDGEYTEITVTGLCVPTKG